MLQSAEFFGGPVVQILIHDKLFHMQSPLEKRLEDDARLATLGNVQSVCPNSPPSQRLLSQQKNHEGETVQTSADEAGDRAAIDWTPIELAVTGGLTFAEAAERFGVKQDSIRKRAKRHNWILPNGLSKIVHHKLEKAVEKAADDWLAKAETHRKGAFELAHESLKKMKPRAPKNFREAEICDKIARRNAGLDNVDSAKQVTLIHVNEAIDAYNQPIELHPKPASLTPCLTKSGMIGQSSSLSSDDLASLPQDGILPNF